jgi:integrase
VDWRSGLLTIARSVYEVDGGGWGEKATKRHQVRRLSLDEVGLAVLRRHRSSVEALAVDLNLKVRRDGFIFSRSPMGSEPIRPNVVIHFMANLSKTLGFKTHLHAIRHFSATELIAQGHDVRTVAGRLGHADASITLRVYSSVRGTCSCGGTYRIPQIPVPSGMSSTVDPEGEGCPIGIPVPDIEMTRARSAVPSPSGRGASRA